AASGYREHRPAALAFLSLPDWDDAAAWCVAHPEEVGAGYSFSKEAVIAYTASRSVALAARGIRINATAPGVTLTPILDATIARLGAEYLDTIPKPLGRLATADEQARVMVFLAGEGASYITGQTIWVDGGYTAGVETGEITPFAVNR
ncbi:SDR family oxidoreductase, partial [Microbacterium lushaniae]